MPALAPPPPAPAAEARAPGDTDAGWLQRPNVDQLRAAWPLAAIQARREGRAKLRCRVTPRGVLADCQVLEESPPGLGFGAAALLLTPNFLMKPPTHDGQPVAGVVTIPIDFRGVPAPSSAPFGSFKVLSWAPWAQSPTLQEVRDVFPAAAQARKVFATVVFRCALKRDGALSDCEVTQETATGLGFAQAARRLLPRFRAEMNPANAAQARDYRVTVAVRFSPRSLDPAPVVWAAAPDWTRLADADAARAAFPAAARAAHVREGRATLECGVSGDGSLTDCRADTESPRDLGFGDAALKLAAAMRANPWGRDGEPLAGERVRLPLRLVDDPAAASGPADAAAKPAG